VKHKHPGNVLGNPSQAIGDPTLLPRIDDSGETTVPFEAYAKKIEEGSEEKSICSWDAEDRTKFEDRRPPTLNLTMTQDAEEATAEKRREEKHDIATILKKEEADEALRTPEERRDDHRSDREAKKRRSAAGSGDMFEDENLQLSHNFGAQCGQC
jgi:hypothetical protein